MALGVGIAHADTGTSGEDGIASGTQGILGIEIPAQLGGNAISIFGDADSSGATTSTPTSAPADASGGTGGSNSLAGGTQLLPELGPPITLGGNSISVFGDASSTGATTAPAGGSADGATASGSTDGTNGVLSGAQVLGDVGVPVTLGGNAIWLLGAASTDGPVTDPGTTPGTGPGTDPGTDRGDDGAELPTYALAADDETALAATGAEYGLVALGLAVVLCTIGGVLLARRAVSHRR